MGGGGDMNAAVGIAGLVVGIAIGTRFLRGGYSLGRARDLPAVAGWAGPAVAAMLLLLAVAIALGRAPGFATVTPAGARATPQGAVVAGDRVLRPPGSRLEGGAVVAPDGKVVSTAAAVAAARPMPGGKRAPLLVALLAGLVLGAVAQRTRLCTTGGIRDLILWRRTDKLLGILGVLAGALMVNALLGQFRLGFTDQPVAHTDALGNFAAMAVAGLAAVLMGGCPLRQVIMAGEGDVDAGGAVLGTVAGALFAHGFRLVSSPQGVAPGAMVMLAVVLAGLLALGFWFRSPAP